MDTSWSWVQDSRLRFTSTQSSIFVSFPLHRKLSTKIGPLPEPKDASPVSTNDSVAKKMCVSHWKDAHAIHLQMEALTDYKRLQHHQH